MTDLVKLGNLDVLLNIVSIECVEKMSYDLRVTNINGREYRFNYGTSTIQQSKLDADFDQLLKLLVKG